uniref:Ig-like domain-containing protein n=1 Tax=Callorhinchus milii TaxID=7868 RepID=A0A4W3IKZ7_CALMI
HRTGEAPEGGARRQGEWWGWDRGSRWWVFTVSGPALPVPAIAGSDVFLDCKCSTDLPREGVEVRWFRTRFESPVHLYKEQLESQDEAYRHRTRLFVEEFINGNVSLRLEGVRVSDNGEYTCLVSNKCDSEFELYT